VFKTGGHHGFAGLILHRDDRRGYIERTIGVSQPKDIAELQRCVALEQNFA